MIMYPIIVYFLLNKIYNTKLILSAKLKLLHSIQYVYKFKFIMQDNL